MSSSSQQKPSHTFAEDIVAGLSAKQKHIASKYFYDDEGSRLFQKIMGLPEYYLTNSEHEILAKQTSDIYQAFNQDTSDFDLIELGAGDGSKTSTLVDFFLQQDVSFRFTPIDISTEALNLLTVQFKEKFPTLDIEAKQGDYFKTLHTFKEHSKRKKIILFLGSTIGNFTRDQGTSFFKELRNSMNKGDFLFIGFDLHKKPSTILSAYSDSQGVTREFNMNLLRRLNKELGADFDVNKFSHYASYDPTDKAARSYLISLENQSVHFKDLDKKFTFKRWEPIFTEISQKFTSETIQEIASTSGFKVCKSFFDSKEYYTNSLWQID